MSGVRKIASAAVKLGSATRSLDRGITQAVPTIDTGVATSEDVYKQAYLEGFAAGEEDGRKEAQRQASESLTQLERALADVETSRQEWQEGLRDALEQFAHATAQQNEAIEVLAAKAAEIAVRRIVGRLHAEDRATEAACRETLRALAIASAQVRVSPSDFDAFAGLPPGIELIADPSLEPGACLVHSLQGDIDAGLATQLEQLHGAFETSLTGERA